MLKHLPLMIGAMVIAAAMLACESAEEEPAEHPPEASSPQAAAQGCSIPPEPTDAPPPPAAQEQSEGDALATDLALIAESQGWTIEQAEAQHLASEAMGPIQSRIAAERPDVFIGGALSEEPGGTPKLYIKGPADDLVREIVATAEIEIEIVDNQPYSQAELHERQTRVVQALQDMGFASISAGSDIQNEGQIEAGVVAQTGLPDEPEEIIAALPEDLRDSVTLTVSGNLPPDGYDFGPLAVLEGYNGHDASTGTGCIRIGEECVTVKYPNGRSILLVWHAREVRWDGGAREITYTGLWDEDSESLTVRDGDIISAGGSSLVGDEPVDLDNLSWLVRPHESCTGDPWSVGGVRFH